MVVSFLELPPELLDKVLAFLDPPSIVRARCICKQLDSAITYSSMLQYIIECYTSGMADNHEPGLSFKERLDLLRRREVAWRSLEKTHSYSIRVPFMSNGLYDFTEGILVLGIGSKETGGYAYLRLPPAGDTSIPSWSYFRVPEKLVDFGLSVIQHDLIAAVTMSVHHQDITFSLYFYSLSDGSPHPMASRPMIRLCSGTTTNEHISALIEIVGDYIIILLTGPAPDKLFLVNWKKGSARLIRSFSQKTYSGLAWLSEDTIVVFNMREVSFDVFRFDGPLEDGVPDMAMIYRLKLPELEDGVTIQLAQCRADPNPLTVPSKSGTRDRPFYTVPETSILLVSLTFFSPGERFTLSIIVHRSALLAAAPLDGYSAEEDPTQPPTVPYKDWGVKSTAWFFNDSSYITVTNGQRYTLIEREFPNADNLDELNVITVRKLYVRDFNPVHVRAARALTDKDDEIAEGLIADRRQLDFTEDYFVDGCPEFELPYVQRTTELPDIFGEIYMDAWVDEQRILLLRLNPLIHDIAGADIWAFG